MVDVEVVREGAATICRPTGELDAFSQGMAAMETKAHLDLLVARGQATSEDDPDGVVYASV